LRFDQPASAFWFDARRLARRMGRDEHDLQNFVSSWPASVIVPQRSDEGIAARVRVHLMASRPHWSGLEETAAALHMSAPTLQRQLAATQASFKALKDELRRDIAITRLGSGHVGSEELAEELGFADAACFQRAFKAWTGCPPGAYRARLALK
jgi:AraC-like DNA-binding protein